MKNRIFITLFIYFISLPLLAQTPVASQNFWSDPINHPMAAVYALAAFVFITVLLVLVVAIVLLRVLNVLIEKVAQERALKLGIPYTPEPSWWQKLDKKITRAIPLEKEATILLDHDYDGIKELDNHLPPWWKWLFYGTIGWSAIYLVIYHVADSMPLMEQEYETEVVLAQQQLQKARGDQPTVSIDESTLIYSNDAVAIGAGKKVYIDNCASCHKEKGEGSIGPNLTDEFWIHGGGIKNIYATIKNGVPDKGMISWSSILKPEEIKNVSFYVMSLQGSNPPNAKPAQGLPWKEENISTDSTSLQAKL